MRNLLKIALKWTAISVWFDFTGRLISAPIDLVLAAYPSLAWLDGYVNTLAR